MSDVQNYAQEVLTAAGWSKKDENYYREKLNERARQLFGDDINTEAGVLNKIIRMQAYNRAEENELAETVFLSRFIPYAKGVALDYLVYERIGKRFGDTKAAAKQGLEIICTPGLPVAAGFVVATPDNVLFRTTKAYTDSDLNGRIYADIEAVDAGAGGNVDVNTITVIKTPLTGVQSAKNIKATTGGRLKETDPELRTRYFAADSLDAWGTTDAIRANILNIPDVLNADVIENDSDVPDEEGRTPHSIAAYVHGGSDEAIANAIYKKKGGGVPTFGTTSVIVKDASGRDKTIRFSRAIVVNVDVEIRIERTSSYPSGSEGDDQLKQAAISIIGGEFQNVGYRGAGMGKDVYASQIIRAVNVNGIRDIQVRLKKEGETTWQTEKITTAYNEVPSSNGERVTIIYE